MTAQFQKNGPCLPPLLAMRIGLLVGVVLCLGCSVEDPDPVFSSLEATGAKISSRDDGIGVDIRKVPEFTNQSIDLVVKHSTDVVDLTMQEMPITDAGIARLAPLKKLGRLILNDTQISGAGLQQLAELPLKDSLWNIGLKNTDITDADLAILPKLPNLVRIDLTGTQVTDQGLESLPERDWNMINVTDTAVTESGVSQLKERFPGVDLRH